MSYQNQYSSSPWQQGGPAFGVGGYNQSYGGCYDLYGVSHQIMNAAYNRNQGGYSGGGGRGMSLIRNMGHYGSTPSRHYMNDRINGRQMGRGQMLRKRLPRSLGNRPRSKRANIESDRRMTKPPRLRYLKGASKSNHGHGEDKKDDTYNPEEPTDGVSDVEYDVIDCWKSSDEDGEAKEKASKEIGEQELADTENTDKDSKTEDSQPKKTFICYVCKVTCSTKERFTKHQNSKGHTAKIDERFPSRREKRKGTGENEKKEKEPSEQVKKSNLKRDNWCTLCECVLTVNFSTHSRTKKHRKKRDKKYPKHRPCRIRFSSPEVTIPEVEIERAAASEDKKKSEEGKTKEKIMKLKKKMKKGRRMMKKVENSNPKEPKCVGQSFVVSVQGYYCKLCRKFFKDGTVAKSKHCRSIMHTDAFKKAMEEAIKQEEERQKVAEAEELASEIAEIERSAKEAAKKEFTAKKADASKGGEMKDVFYDKASKSDAASKETKDESANEDGMENGVKKDSKEEMDDSK